MVAFYKLFAILVLKYLVRRFDRRIQFFGALLFIVESTIWLPIAIYVPALTFNQVTGLDIHIVAPIVCGICIFYTTVGGIKAVIFADFIQSFVMFGSIFLVMVKGTLDIGGFGVVWQRNMDSGRIELPELTLDPTVRMSMIAVIIGGTIYKIQNQVICQPAVQRLASLPSKEKMKQTMILYTFFLTLLLLACCYVGMVTYATYHDCDPMTTKLAKAGDQLVPLLVMDVLGSIPGLSGLFVSAVFSAALSSLSTILNSMSAVILEDFAKPLTNNSLTETQTAVLLRGVVIVFGVASVGLVYVVEKLGLVLQLSVTLQSITTGPMLGIFILGICMPWINSKSALVGSALAFVSMGWVCIRGQIATIMKELVAPTKPTSVEGCSYAYEHVPIINSTFADQPEPERALHHISWLWYCSMGALLTIAYANLGAIFFGRNNIDDVDKNLIAPFLQRYYKSKKYESVKMIHIKRKIDEIDN